MKVYKTTKKSGFTLLDTVFGSAVFLIGAMGSFGLMSWTMQANNTSGRVIGAAAAAQTKLEELVEIGYDNLTGGSGASGQYTLTWKVTPTNGYKMVNMRVGWSSYTGQRHSYDDSTIVCDVETSAILPWFAETGRGGAGGVVFTP